MAEGVGKGAGILSRAAIPDGPGVGTEGAAAEKAEGKPGEEPAPKKATRATHGKGRTYAAQVDRGPWERLLLSNEHPGCWLG